MLTKLILALFLLGTTLSLSSLTLEQERDTKWIPEIKEKEVKITEVKFSRWLRRGYSGRSCSGSWGGSSSRSSGGWNRKNSNYNRNRSYNNRNGMSRMGKVFYGLAIGAFGLALLSILAPGLGVGACCPFLVGICCGGAGTAAAAASSSSNNGSDYRYMTTTHADDEKFQENISRARTEVESTGPVMIPPSSNDSNSDISCLDSGEYTTQYVDGGVLREATLNIQFHHLQQQPSKNGFMKISGHGYDIDGKTVIDEGMVNVHSGRAYWVERTIQANHRNDRSLKVLSRGTFTTTKNNLTSKNIFIGTWLANTHQSGTYISFQKKDTAATTTTYGNMTPSSEGIIVSSNPHNHYNYNNHHHGNQNVPPTTSKTPVVVASSIPTSSDSYAYNSQHPIVVGTVITNNNQPQII